MLETEMYMCIFEVHNWVKLSRCLYPCAHLLEKNVEDYMPLPSGYMEQFSQAGFNLHVNEIYK